MSTISFSVEDELKRDIAAWAKQANKSQSGILRDMVAVYKFNEQLEGFTERTEDALSSLGITSEEELATYLESDETYQSRLRRQRLSGRNQSK